MPRKELTIMSGQWTQFIQQKTQTAMGHRIDTLYNRIVDAINRVESEVDLQGTDELEILPKVNDLLAVHGFYLYRLGDKIVIYTKEKPEEPSK